MGNFAEKDAQLFEVGGNIGRCFVLKMHFMIDWLII